MKAGDAVLADIRLLSTAQDQPIVTRGIMSGRGAVLNTFLTRQKCAQTEPPDTPFYLAHNMIWAGDVILRGGGVGIAVHTRTLTAVYMLSHVDEYDDTRTEEELFLASEGVSAPQHMAKFLRRSAEKVVVDYETLRGMDDEGAAAHRRQDSGNIIVAETLVGVELERVPPNAEDMLQVYRACALLSQSSLGLESMKRFNNGLVVADCVEEEENGHTDSVGTALLRFALQGLKGSE